MSSELISLLERGTRPRVFVVGDVMLDRYLWGNVDRISPEAPIPVLRLNRQEHRLGGAGSVAAMLAAMDADVGLASVVGDDEEGGRVRELLDRIGVPLDGLLTVGDRPTTLKERVLGHTQSRHPQQMMRLDRESRAPLPPDLAWHLLNVVETAIPRFDLVLVSDYDKGVCAGSMVAHVVAQAQAAGVPVVADPVRGFERDRYRGCACITPNRHEAGLAAGMKIGAPEQGLEAARRLLDFGLESVVVTLDRDGMVWADRQGRSGLVPARPREVYDITGAGDEVLCVLGCALALGADLPEAVELANLAGGLEVERLGVVPVTRAELLAEVLRRHLGPASAKVVSLAELQTQLASRRQAGQRIVMTNGCFDLLHPGHVAALQEARTCGDCLVVGLNSDVSVRRLKGPGRPVIDQAGRAAMLAALACVDYVVLFDETSVRGLVEQVMPDVLAKSAQYGTEAVVGGDLVVARGGRVVLTSMAGDYSTSSLLQRIRQLAAEEGASSSE